MAFSMDKPDMDAEDPDQSFLAPKTPVLFQPCILSSTTIHRSFQTARTLIDGRHT